MTSNATSSIPPPSCECVLRSRTDESSPGIIGKRRPKAIRKRIDVSPPSSCPIIASRSFRRRRIFKPGEAAARLADWNRKRPAGTGLGIAGHFTFGTYAACVVEVSVNASNELRIHRAWGAIDCGFAINPNHIRSQMEGGFVDGFNAALFNNVQVANGRVVNDNFGTLRWIRMREAPPSIEIAIIDSGYEPTGVGEPPLPPSGAAMANAIFAACGKRIRRMPLADSIKI
jgi:isoquinoline 1-oxidoreductase beta subunit